VVRFKADLDITLTVEDKELTNKTNVIFNVKGDGYRYTKLSNGNVISDTNYKFEVTKNGTYSVEVYDRYDNKFVKEIEITNIDDEAPTGNCVVNRTANSSIFQVTANDNKGIAGYSYIFETTETDFQTLSEYSVQNKIETGKVKVKDVSGNVSELTCEMKEVWDGNCFTSITIPKSYGHRLRGHQDECKNYVKTTGKMSNLCTVTIESSSGIVKGGTNTKGACFTPTDYGNGEITVTYSASCMCDGKPVTGTTNFRISEWGLRSISVSPGSLSPSFYNATYNYTVHVSAGTTSIRVGASANHERSKVSGTGTYTLSGKTTRITVSSTTPEGVTTPYYITVIKDD
ncbi:MAG: hypothetical protein IJB71_00570, partial [Bacilli bacterium]|nr:hypothetical protein [Bacilli bacterium]